MNFDIYLVPYTNFNSKMITDLNVKFKATKLLDDSTRKIYMTLRQIVFRYNTKPRSIKECDKLDIIKI